MTILSGAYRVFFPAAGLMAALAVPLWVFTQSGSLDPGVQITQYWHTHEMLFGYLGAALAGFLLTAIPNWTNRPALTGLPLLGLFLLWLAGRAVMFAAPDAAAITLIFPAALALFTTREIVLGGNTRNLVVAGAVWLFVLAQAVMLWGDPSLGQRMGFAIAASIITLIGGRVTPAFTRNWLKAKGQAVIVPGFGLVDRIALSATVAAALSWVVMDMQQITGVLAGAAAIAQLLRLVRWKGRHVTSEPLMLALHAAYGWLVLAWGLLAFDALNLMSGGSAAFHAFGAGAVGTMTLIVMIRALLGHSGQPITANRLDVIALVLVHLGAALRLAASSTTSQEVLVASGLLWSAGFAAFVLRALPLAFSSRA